MALRCVTVCRRYCIHKIVGGPYDRVALFILDVTDAGQHDGAQQRHLQPTDHLRSEFELRICQSHLSLLKESEKFPINVDDFLGMAATSFMEGVLSM